MRMLATRQGFAVLVALALAACGGGDHGYHVDGSTTDRGTTDGFSIDGSPFDATDSTVPHDGPTGIPDGATVLPDGQVILADGAVWDPDASTVEIPDGATVLPDGQVILADGAVWNPDGSTVEIPDGATVLSDGQVILADGAVWNPDAEQIPDGATVLPDGQVILADGAPWTAEAGAPYPDGSFVLPDGAVILADGAVWTPDGGPVACPTFADGGAACGTHEVCGNGLDDNCNGLVDESCPCLPGIDHERCYDGCPSQAGVGECVWGSMACTGSSEIGNYDGHCMGAGHPEQPVCGGLRDYRCDGIIDEGCSCAVGDTRPCYDGPSSTRNVGVCTDGVQHCVALDGGTGWGTCTGEVLPSAPMCDGIDHACTGDPYGGCACTPGTTRSCYDGPTGTAGVGVCMAGQQSCVVTGGVAAWGMCVGEVTPSADLCDGIDRACNGNPTAGCACAPGTSRSCYDGPTGTSGVGLCHPGSQSCITGTGGTTSWGPCTGEVLPSAEVCDGLDHLCNGMPNTGCACAPGATRSCYDGAPGTAGVGLCHAGTQTCAAGTGGVGSSWGACTGEVLPASDRCDGVDRACDGMPNASCACSPGSTRSCYDGPAGTSGVGQCRAGTQTCNGTGTGWSACTGEVLPSAEVCDGIDHLCNGMPNTGCACMPGATQNCYDGPAGTAGVGLCHTGTQSCVAGPGGIGSSWGACTGEVTPSASRCDGVDRACTGMPYLGCACVPGSMRSCYSGPTGTAGVGLCHSGTQSCTDPGTGPAWGTCVGQVTPTPEICDGMDHLCNGMPNQGCACTPGTMRSCYDGPAGTAGVGQCRAGSQLCNAGPGGVGSSWGSCTGEVLPGAIACDGIDHACDGNYNSDCPCTLGQTRSCYDGPAGTAGVGTCAAGTENCMARTGGGTQWSTTCTGEVVPAAPQCDGLDHACTGTLPNCAPTVMCPAPVSTRAGVGVSLTGMASAIAPATITGYTWSVISAPSGATYMFSSTTTNPTTFTPNNGGVYTVRFTATDSMGRSASCSVLVTSTANSYLGTEFWAVTTSNSQLATGFNFAVAVGNPNPTATIVTISGGALAAPINYTVPANSTVTQNVPWVTALSHNDGSGNPPTSSLVSNGAYRISTTQPVSAYEFNPIEFQVGGNFSYTNDASLLLPTVALTGNYIAMTHQAWYTLGDFVTIVGTNAMPTTVTVQLTSAISAGTGVAATAGPTTQTYTLNHGDVIQLVSVANNTCMGTPNFCPYDTNDLTGTVITATNPVAVFGGHDCSNIGGGGTGNCPACDHLEQQMFPVETWGRDVVVSQLQDRGNTTEPYNVRILSRYAGNTLTFIPASVHAPVTLAAGGSIEFCSTADFEVTGTQPIMVGQFMTGQNVSACGGACTSSSTVGDPSFALEVPTPQYRTNYNFVVPGTYTASFINVVGATGATIQLDGTNLVGTGTAIAGSSWSVWRQAVSAGSHTISTAGATGFGLKVLGVASFTSYTYPGGLDLRALP